MRCLSPLNIPDPRYGNTRIRIEVPCGKCAACLARRRDDWSFRLSQELKVSQSAHFVTLTYDDLHIPYNDFGYVSVNKVDCQLFMKRLRKAIQPNKIKYYLVSEYGTKTARPHYHMILYNFPLKLDIQNIIQNAWQNGGIHIGNVTGASIQYCCKYIIQKASLPDDVTPPFSLMSQGLGKNYLTSKMRNYHSETQNDYVVKDGYKCPIPRYLRNKLFNPIEIEHLNSKRQSLEQMRAEIDFIKAYNEKIVYTNRVNKTLKQTKL